ncbi:MAG TPA: glycosyltransferase [Candidatus Saccharimonadales bacterium]
MQPPTRYLAPLAWPYTVARLLAARLVGTRLVHIHWLYFLELPLRGRFFRRVSFLQTVALLHIIHLLGMRLVWTAHNVVGHEGRDGYGIRITRTLSAMADRIIVHSPQTTRQLSEAGADTSRTVVIPHGNYDGVYPTRLGRVAARKHFGVAPNARVILFFGLIRPYKGVEKLLEAFKQLKSGDHLLIAGECQPPDLARSLTAAATEYRNITFIHQSVPEEEVADYFAAADIVCMPFQTITTSGSAILAATFGKPLVAPRLGAIKEIPAGAGIFYQPGSDSHTLQHALEQALAGNLKSMGHTARHYADTLSWDDIAAKTYALYQEILTPSSIAS